MHWTQARSALRVRDKVHHRDWRLLTIAGPAPDEEINCIRELMPRAHITSIDIDAANIVAAIEAGADEIFQCDISFQQKIKVTEHFNGGKSETKYYDPPECFKQQEETKESKAEWLQWDVICLDLTGSADDWLNRLVQVYFSTCLVNHGVLMVTFSYGRDVIEVYEAAWQQAIHEAHNSKYPEHVERLEGKMPTPIAQRVWYLLGSRTQFLDSCLQYRGGMMPMVSCLLRKGSPKPPEVKFEAIERADYALAVTAEDAGRVFACPADRLEELRIRYGRRQAAYKAIETRRLRENKQPQLRLVEPPMSRVQELEQFWDDLTDDDRAEFWKMLHRQYTSSKTKELIGPDVSARTALLEDLRRDRDSNGG